VADAAVEEVLGLIGDDENLPRLVEVLADLTDKQRRSLSGPVGKRAAAMWLDHDGHNALTLAVLGCANAARQAATRIEWLTELDDEAEPLAVDVVRARRPHWLPSLPEALLVGGDRRPSGFRLIRALVRARLVEPPELPEYTLSMVHGLVGRHDWPEGPSVLERLRADPGLLDREVWDLFTTEGAGKLLSPHDSWLSKPFERWGDLETIPARPEKTWQHAVVQLAADGSIDRARALDAALGALFRDWTAGDVGWFVKLHDALDPTIDELQERRHTYGRLLAVDPGPPVNLGLRALGRLLAAERLDLDVLLANGPALFARSDKAPVVAGLKLLDAAARARPDATERIARCASHALSHDRIDVQERALKLLTKLVPDDVHRDALVAAHADGLAPSLRGAPQPGAVTTPAPPTERPPAARLEPVSDADELAELLARLIEEADDPAEVERLLDGTARLARSRPTRGTDALVKRLHHLAGSYYPGPWWGQDVRADLVQLGRVWLEKAPPGRGYAGREYAIEYSSGAGAMRAVSRHRRDWSLTALVTMRIHEVAKVVAAGGGRLLSFPTYRDGVLEARELNVRVGALGRASRPLTLDAGLAILRVPPEQYAQLRLPGAHRTGKVLNDQLGLLRERRPEWDLVIGESEGLFRQDILERAISWRDRAAPRGEPDNVVTAVLDRSDPMKNIALEAADGEYVGRFEQVTGMWPLMLPHHVDVLAAHAHARLTRALTKNRSATEPLLDAIGAANHQVGPPSASALILGLAAKNGVERTRAIDAIGDLSGRSLLAGSALGTQLTALLGAEAVVGSRVVMGLADTARSGTRAGDVVLDCLVEALPALPGRRDAHQFVDLLAQLAIERSRTVTLPEPLVAIARSKQSSMLAKACRRVPQVSG
jgi:hypothetical protein